LVLDEILFPMHQLYKNFVKKNYINFYKKVILFKGLKEYSQSIR